MDESASRMLLPCLIIHPTLDRSAPESICFSLIQKHETWLDFFTLGIRLPEIREEVDESEICDEEEEDDDALEEA